MSPTEIRQMSRSEIEQLLRDKEEELSNLRMQLVTRQLDNPLLIRRARRDVAQLKTVFREQELGIRSLPGETPADSQELAS
ncbi:MAG: 50S ribosomal protein L29 [Candidatus Latescibacteria bacterium]|jgi:large subunit ribosomal protein L29|nr:50S ribosomal protein L29 [Candidatus Latescibacterota bacterium]